MGGRYQYFGIVGLALSLVPFGVAAQTIPVAQIDLRAGALSDALRALAIQSGAGILFSPDIVQGVRIVRISGAMSPEVALRRVLLATGLAFRRTRADTFIVYRPKAPLKPEDTVSRAEEIIVSGARRVGAIKQASDTEITVITELETKRLPTLDVSDILIRLPGVRRNDTQSGENRYVSIRGMNNAAASQSIDGVLLTNYIARSRATSTEAITAAFFKSVVVTTAATPDLDENSNAAHVALTTISGLDGAGEHLLDVRAFGGWDSRAGGLRSSQMPVRGSATWHGKLDDAGRIGASFGVGLDRLGQRQDAVSVTGYSPAGGTFVPNGALTNGQTYTRTERISALARLDFRPSDRLSVFLEYLFVSHHYATDQLTSSVEVSAAAAENVTPRTGQFGNASGSYSFNNLASPLIRDHIFQFGADAHPDDRDTLSFRAGVTLNQVREQGLAIGGFNAPEAALASPVRYTYASNALELTPGSNMMLNDPGSYQLAGKVTIEDLESSDRNVFARLDYAHDAAPDDRGFGVKIGAQLKTLDVDDQQRGYAMVLAPGQSISLADVAGAAPATMLKPIDIDEAKLLALIKLRGMLSPDANGLYAADPADGFGQSFNGTEQIVDLYGVATYGFGRARLSAGLRAAHTSRALQDYEPDAWGLWNPVRYHQRYWDLLPAIYGHYALNDHVKLRATLSTTMERPPVNGSGKSNLTSYDTPVTQTISYSDPYLKPIRSNNAETSAEYAYGPYNSFLTLGVFAKQLRDIPALSSTQTLGADGVRNIVNYTTNVTQVNGKPVFGHMRGIELVWGEPRLAFFPQRLGALGLTLSYSYIVYQLTVVNGGNGVPATDTRLVDVAPRNYFNAALYYNFAPVSANVFAQKQSSNPTLSYDPATDHRAYYGVLINTQINYTLSSKARLMVEVNNLTDQHIVDRYGLSGYTAAYQVRRDGRTVWIGAQFNIF